MVTKNSKTKGRKSGRQTKAAHNINRRNTVRLSKEKSAEREAFALEYFLTNPEATGTSLNDLFAKKGQPKMNVAKVYKLRAQAQAQVAKGPGAKAPAQATGTNGAEAAPVIPEVEFESARRVAGLAATKMVGRGGSVIPFDRVKAEASKLWKLMQATGLSAVTIVEGQVHLSGKFQMTEPLA